jgi:hypothetical protein
LIGSALVTANSSFFTFGGDDDGHAGTLAGKGQRDLAADSGTAARLGR